MNYLTLCDTLIKEAGLELNSQIDDYAGLPRVTTALRPET